MRRAFYARALTAFASLVSALALQGERAPSARATRPDLRVGFHDAVTTHVVQMQSNPIPNAHENHLRRREARSPITGLTNVHDTYYIIDLLVGNQTISVSVDTGSSDTWMVQEPYECVSFRFERPGVVSYRPFYSL